MRRIGMIVALGALLGMLGGAAVASPALARGPGWQLLPAEPFTLPAAFCGFRVQVTPVVNDRFGKLLKTSDSSMILLHTGFLSVSYTNLVTGKAITENVSGPLKITVFPDGSATMASKGRTSLFLPPDDAQRFGLPSVAVTAGALTGSVAPDGSLTSLTLDGTVLVDVCTALS